MRRDYGEDRFITAGHWTVRGAGLDAARRGTPHHFHQARTCRRRSHLVCLNGPIPTTRRR